LINRRSGETIAAGIEVALTRSARRRGLLSHTALHPDEGLVLAPCQAIHTAFMRFAIDVIFLDRTGCVLRIVRRLPPWRVAASFHAYATIELAAGALDARDVLVGDPLYLAPYSAALSSVRSLFAEAAVATR
jgi:uncharacterized membrane protein (UPF0127 family)